MSFWPPISLRLSWIWALTNLTWAWIASCSRCARVVTSTSISNCVLSPFLQVPLELSPQFLFVHLTGLLKFSQCNSLRKAKAPCLLFAVRARTPGVSNCNMVGKDLEFQKKKRIYTTSFFPPTRALIHTVKYEPDEWCACIPVPVSQGSNCYEILDFVLGILRFILDDSSATLTACRWMDWHKGIRVCSIIPYLRLCLCNFSIRFSRKLVWDTSRW